MDTKGSIPPLLFYVEVTLARPMTGRLNEAALARACTEARGLALDTIAGCKSGHLGLPLGAAEIGSALFGYALVYRTEDSKWINRDRFVLSAGHGSAFLYAWLHMSGFDISVDDLKRFRTLHSKTPGHPEFGETDGVECTTGPLGQGVGNAVGMAIAAKMAGAIFNTKEHTIIDHVVACLAGDGCIQEGVAAETSAFAAHCGLDNLIILYDSNDVTLDAMGSKTQSEDTARRYEAYGWDTETVDGHKVLDVLHAFNRAKKNKNGKPKLIICKTIIGKGIPEVEGTNKAHGEAGVKFADAARKALGLPEDQHYYVSEETRRYFDGHKNAMKRDYDEWTRTFQAWRQAQPALAQVLDAAQKGELPLNLMDRVPAFPADSKPDATRNTGGVVLNVLAKEIPLLVSGSADLHGSTKNYIKDVGDFSRDENGGRNIYWGIREHCMGATMNGIAYYGLFRVSGATFLTFSDYLRPSIRLAALAKLPVCYIFTHDSIGVGEDGPTHQPVETIMALRCIPRLDVIRPADVEETAGAFVVALERKDGPTALVLSRQNVPNLASISPQERREGVRCGGYIAVMEKGGRLDTILLATGSEVQHAIAAAAELGDGIRVVSLPCWERFERQPQEYRDHVLPPSCRRRVAIEAGVSLGWHKWIGLEGKTVCVEGFGLSAPANHVMKEKGITVENLVAVVRAL